MNTKRNQKHPSKVKGIENNQKDFEHDQHPYSGENMTVSERIRKAESEGVHNTNINLSVNEQCLSGFSEGVGDDCSCDSRSRQGTNSFQASSAAVSDREPSRKINNNKMSDEELFLRDFPISIGLRKKREDMGEIEDSTYSS